MPSTSPSATRFSVLQTTEREVLPLPWSGSRLSEGMNGKKKSMSTSVSQLSWAKSSHQAWRQCRISAHVARQWCFFPPFSQNLETAQPIRWQHYVTWLREKKLKNLARARRLPGSPASTSIKMLLWHQGENSWVLKKESLVLQLLSMCFLMKISALLVTWLMQDNISNAEPDVECKRRGRGTDHIYQAFPSELVLKHPCFSNTLWSLIVH